MKAQLKPRINLEGRTPLQDVIPLATPFVLFVDPASVCNFLCPFCPTGHRKLIHDTGRFQGVMRLELFRKIIDDLAEFDRPIKVLRMYKDGEPFLNKNLAKMVAYAKQSGFVEYIDTTTNASLMTPERLGPILEAGLDKINISVDGMNREQYREFTGFDLDFNKLIEHVKWLDANKGRCEVVIKIPGDLIDAAQRQEFLDAFGDHCDRIFIENFAPCWPEFDVEAHTGVKITKGIHQQPVLPTDTCPYIFYSVSVNSDGLVSSCFLDWGRKLLIGDLNRQTLKEVWHSKKMNALRRQHLEGRRKENPVCSQCGQLSHCLPDNIDSYRDDLLPRFLEYTGEQLGEAPGSSGSSVISVGCVITVLHVTPHLGGGVGKALSGLIAQAHESGAPVRHIVACLEKPEKMQFLDRVRDHGTEVVVAPNLPYLNELVAGADIVQLEWWNHPATIERLCSMALQPMRLLVWCHVSGLYSPVIPPKLMEVSNRFLFTSPCSFEAKEVSGLAARLGSRLGVVSSGGGFSDLSEPSGDEMAPLSVGYLGSLNYAKLHPDYVNFLSAVNLPHFRVRLIGDLLNREILERQSDDVGRAGMLDFRGYTNDVAAELSAINVLAYLLNPRHFGTAENALLEAMAMGIVPIVLDNPAERNIVEHFCTGIIVRSPGEFADAMTWLAQNPRKRSKMGLQAAESVRRRFTLEKMEASLRTHYEDVVTEEKRPIQFQSIFGTTPDRWFLSCHGNPAIFESGDRIQLLPGEELGFGLFERTKGSVFHFHEYFPENENLTEWTAALRRESPKWISD